MANPYAPDETSAQIFAEQMWLQGSLVSNIAYGIQFVLFCLCFNAIVNRMDTHNRKRQLPLLAFVTLLFIFGTIFMITDSKFVQMAFINNRNYPGGPGAYEVAMFSVPVDETATAVFVISNWIMDAFVVWRFLVIYKGSGQILLTALMVLPCLMLLASIALGTIFLVSTRSSSPFSAVDLTIAYYVMSLALNVIVTILIVARLLVFRWRIAKVLGSQHVSCYSNVAAMLVESASLYSVFAILYLIPFSLNYALSDAMINIVSQVQTIASLLIIYRVAAGKAWSNDTSTQLLTRATSSGRTIQLREFATMRANTDEAVDSVASRDGRILDGVKVTRDVVLDEGHNV